MSAAKSRVLIVGGAAFLGAHLVRRLVREREFDSITIMDLRAYAGPHAREVVSVRGDLTRPEDCARVLASGPFDAVISMVTPDLMRGTAEAFTRVNVDGVRTLLAACREHRVRSFVYVSSIAVLDHFCAHVDVDEREPLPPLEQYRSPYDRSKRLGEELVLAADAPDGMRTCALRLGGVLSDMRDVTLRYVLGRVVVVQGYGEPIDMIYAGNAAHGIALAARGLLDRPEALGGQAMFLTKGRALRTYDYLSLVAAHFGRRVHVMPPLARQALLTGFRAKHQIATALGRPGPGIPMHAFLQIQSYAQTFDNSKIQRLLGYAPLCSLEDGIAEIVERHREQDQSSSRR